MAKNYQKRTRRIYKNESTKNKETINSKGNAKAKTKTKGDFDFGSGNIESKGNENKNKIKGKIPDIKVLERETLQYIIGQDKQVRQLITAIYRAIKFKTIKSNV